MNEAEQLNPQMRWNWRKTKREIKKRAKTLTPGISYAWGCRGHPGLVVKRNYWPDWGHQDLYGADVEIKSLVDGVVESCSIFHCAPQAISREEAEREAELIRTTHDFDISIMNGYSREEVREWWDDWVAEGAVWYGLHDQDGFTVRSGAVMTKEDAEAWIERMRKHSPGLTNPRMVDMRTYPVPPKLMFE